MAQQIDLLKNTSFEGKMDSLIAAILKGENYDYNPLTNKPSINGYTLEGNKTNAQLGIPTKTSDITNDSGFVEDKNYVHTDNNYTTADKNSVATIGDKVDKVTGKGLSTNDLTDALKANYDDAHTKAHEHSNKAVLDATTASFTLDDQTKLTNIESGAQKNTVTGVKGSAEENYRVGNVNITKTNVGLENVANERQWSETNHPTTMSGYGINVTKSDVGLDNVPNVSTNNQTPTFTKADSRDLPISGETLSTLFGKILKWFSDLKSVAFSGDYNDLTNQPTNATTNTNGLMSKDDKTKLDGIDSGANKTTVDSELNSTSTNPVQNKVINDALNDKLSTTGTAAKATADASGNTITTSYASTIEISGNTMILKSKSGATLKSITLPSSQPTWS